MPSIAIPIFVHDVPTTVAAMRQAVAAGASLIELRCDTAPLDVIESVVRAKHDILVHNAPVPVIVTIRPTWEGGHYDGDDQHRIALFEHAGLAGADYIDVEFVAWQRSANLRQKIMLVCRHPDGKDDAGRIRTCQLILSNHDFTGRPADLHDRLRAMEAVAEASVLKLVWKASSPVDGLEALRLTREHASRDPKGKRPLLALAMGEPGQISRLLGAKFGSPFTFATLPNDPGSAPGQPSIADILTTYRWSRQTLDAPTYAVIGHPIGHSLSPAIHNAGFDALNLPGVYVPLLVSPDYASFAATVHALRTTPHMNLRGLSVTIPHKENALRYARENGATIDPLTAEIGVANTLIFNDTIHALNSDYPGSLDALVAAMHKSRADLSAYRVAVLGAGGAARAIVAGLATCGVTVVIYNRTLERAAELARDFNGRTGKVVAVPFEKLCQSCCQIIINCTPIGMHPKIDASPLDDATAAALTSDHVVFDTVYNPLKTKLLQQAEARGATLVTGMEMFIRQAAIQFQAFTGREAPIDLFRQVMLTRLQSPY